MATYADPQALVDTEWVAQHLQDPKVRIVEVDYDPATAAGPISRSPCRY